MLIIEDDPYYFLQFDKVEKSSPISVLPKAEVSVTV